MFQLAGAYALFVGGIRHVTATEASLVGMLEPIANPIWASIGCSAELLPLAVFGPSRTKWLGNPGITVPR